MKLKLELEITMSQETKDAFDALIAKIKPEDNTALKAEIDAVKAAQEQDKQDIADLTAEVVKALTQLTAGDTTGATATLQAVVPAQTGVDSNASTSA